MVLPVFTGFSSVVVGMAAKTNDEEAKSVRHWHGNTCFECSHCRMEAVVDKVCGG